MVVKRQTALVSCHGDPRGALNDTRVRTQHPPEPNSLIFELWSFDSDQQAILQSQTEWRPRLDEPRPHLDDPTHQKRNDGDETFHIRFSDCLRYGVIDGLLCRFCWNTASLSIDIILDRTGLSLPPMELVKSVGDLVVVSGTQSIGVDNLVTLDGDLHARLEPPLTQPSAADGPQARNVLCDTCRQSRIRVSCYFCTICQPDGYDLCSSCLLKGQWCKETDHVLESRTEHGQKLSWKYSHSLFIVDTSKTPTGERNSLLKRASSTVSHLPSIAPKQKRIFWFLDRSHVLLFDYENECGKTCPIQVPDAGSKFEMVIYGQRLTKSYL